jgi:hypothetical protein
MKIREVLASEKDSTILILNLIKQIIYTSLFALFYPLLSWMTFGEGSNGFIYTKAYAILYILILIFPTAIYNLIRYLKNVREKKFGIAKSYVITEAVLIILLILFGIIHVYF